MKILGMQSSARCFWQILQIISLLIVPFSYSTAGSILTVQDGYAGSYFVGASNWSEFTVKLNMASGNKVSFASNFENLSQMLNYDALLLPARDQTDTLSSAEVSAIQSFISTGKRVLLFGENNNWQSWNQQIISLAGGSYVEEAYDSYWGESQRLLDNEITDAADSILGFWVGVADGGVQLYSGRNFVTLWGNAQNVLTILDENVVENGYQDQYSNAKFTTNVANWLAGNSSVPEPATTVLVLISLTAMTVLRRRNA